MRRVVVSSSQHEVAWTASDGAEAIALARVDRPDLILMDLFMPGVDGVEATRRIMGESPCAILVVTSTVSGHLSKVYQAMGYGALDALDTPTLSSRGQINGAALLLHKIEIIGKLIGKPVERSHAAQSTAVPIFQGAAGFHYRGAARTSHCARGLDWGPNALAEVLAHLPATLKAAVIIVQHVDAAFAPGLGQWLSGQAQRRVTLVTEGYRPVARDILLSGTDDHLIMGEDRRLHYSVEPRSVSYRPSVDVFLSSLAKNWPTPGVAALMTGMGRDGAAGLLKLRAQNWRTIAQDEASSIVWGMPKAAAEIGAAEEILPLSHIAEAIGRLVADVADRFSYLSTTTANPPPRT